MAWLQDNGDENEYSQLEEDEGGERDEGLLEETEEEVTIVERPGVPAAPAPSAAKPKPRKPAAKRKRKRRASRRQKRGPRSERRPRARRRRHPARVRRARRSAELRPPITTARSGRSLFGRLSSIDNTANPHGRACGTWCGRSRQASAAVRPFQEPHRAPRRAGH